MKRFYLYGDTKENVGPCNVNRSWVENSDGSMDYARNTGRVMRRLEKIWGCITHRVVLFSGGSRRPELYLCKLLGKRIIYVMHGCARYENVVNKLGMSGKELQLEYDTLTLADKIVAVSERYAAWVRKEYPEFAHKVTFVNNGLEISHTFYPHQLHDGGKYTIAVSGGNLPIKNNLKVCEAVKKLVNEGMNIEVKVFGLCRDNGEPIFDYPFAKRMGQMGKDSYYEELKNTDLYIISSNTESFGLVVGDAVNCGCSLLLSKYVGAASIFNQLLDEDVLEDNQDTEEMAAKIKHLLLHGNAKRMFEAVDSEKCSGKQAYLKLKQICLDL